MSQFFSAAFGVHNRGMQNSHHTGVAILVIYRTGSLLHVEEAIFVPDVGVKGFYKLSATYCGMPVVCDYLVPEDMALENNSGFWI